MTDNAKSVEISTTPGSSAPLGSAPGVTKLSASSASLDRNERSLLERAEQQINSIVVGKAAVVRLAFCSLLAGGHVLLEDLPGVGKTTLAHAFAKTFALDFKRIQFTSDLMPADLVGVSIYRKSNERFEFVPGPLFTQILLADELNRGSAKTQSALLEAMAEAQITVDGETRQLHTPFFVIATQNPHDQAGTFALPESQLDRFMMTLSLGYPDPASERELLTGVSRKSLLHQQQAVLDENTLKQIQAKISTIKCANALVDYLQRLIAGTRNHPEIRHGLSPRGALALVAAARAYAAMSGRDYVIPEDVQAVFVAVVAHRLSMLQTQSNATLVAQQLLKSVAVV